VAVRSRALALKSALSSSILLAGGLAAACRRDTKPRAEETARAADPGPPREVELEPVVLQEIEQQIEISGTLAADVQVSLSTKVPGHLANVLVDLSSPVKQGQVIARIEATDYENGVRQAEAALAHRNAMPLDFFGLEP
jgi:membrane fusion protein, multidrug efflux system